MKKLSIIFLSLLFTVGMSLGVNAADTDDAITIQVSHSNVTSIADAPSSEEKTATSETATESDDNIYPSDISYQTVGDTVMIYKTFEISDTVNPADLIEDTFSKGGYRYRYYEMMQKDIIVNGESKDISQSQAGVSDSDNLVEFLATVPNEIPYNDDSGFEGTLHLVADSVHFEKGDTKNYSYTVRETKSYNNLSTNDPSLLDKTITVGGRTLKLDSISWTPSNYETMGYSDVPTGYDAIGHYIGSANSSQVTNYQVTYDYAGEVHKQLPDTNTYTLVYLGEKVIIPFNYFPVMICVIVLTILVVALFFAIRLRSNVKIYKIKDGIPNYFCKTRIDPNRPFVDISQAGDVPLRIVISKGLHRKLRNDKVYVGGINDNFHVTFTDVVAIEIPSESQRTAGEGLEQGELVTLQSDYNIENEVYDHED